MQSSNQFIQTHEVLIKDQGKWFHFSDPHRVVVATNLGGVLPALREIEWLVQENGWYAAGFLSYEAAAAFDSALETRSPIVPFPYLWFGLYPQPRVVELPEPQPPLQNLDWHPTIDRETYNTAIHQIKSEIADGQTYQVNFTMRLQTDFHGDPWTFFLQFAQRQNNHAAYVDVGNYVICSASPELFFRLDGDTITCRPMKGTVRRGRTTAEDRERSAWLQASEKNRAENVMIVDMIRNDLGRIAKTGSVCVPRLFETERYPTLWQMTSTVRAKTEQPLTDIFAALFPCASITGAPKASTMRIIARLENSPRNIYTGSIGYISPGRTAKFSVAIRTVLIDRISKKAEYGVGGGIVWDSTTADEYAEALLKARLLTHQEPRFSLVETVLWTPNEGFFLEEKHLTRMLDSASYFDISITKENLEKYFEQISSRFSAPQRVRVLLDQSGNLRFESSPFGLEKNPGVLTACLAREPMNSQDVFLFHKTTYRAIYDSARESSEKLDDVLLYNEAGELTEFTIGNLVVELDGQLLTPPLACGVLPGTFRAHLLETGQIIERMIPVERLRDCTAIFRVNSIRKWEEVDLQN